MRQEEQVGVSIGASSRHHAGRRLTGAALTATGAVAVIGAVAASLPVSTAERNERQLRAKTSRRWRRENERNKQKAQDLDR